MRVVFSRDINSIETSQGIGIALGNFDGLHLGHMELVNRTMRICKDRNLRSMVYTFNDHPENIIAGKVVTPLITSNEMKADILRHYDLDYLYFEEFNEFFMKMDPEAFVKKILVEKFNVKAVIVGFDYRFGHKGAGDIQLLTIMAQEYGFYLDIVQPVKLGDVIVSSSIIRKLIREGDVEQASKFMNRLYTISGKVVRGKKLGNTIGFPTINLIPDDNLVLPSKGVYITNAVIDNHIFYSVTNVGENPTFQEKGIKIETYILNFEGNLYGSNVSIRFIKKIRDEKKFNSISELTNQIARDVEYANKYFSSKGIYNKINMC